MFFKVFEFLTLPIVLLNFGASIVGGIWLGFYGEWKLIGLGILLFLTSKLWFSILMLPNIAVSGIASRYSRKNKTGFFIFGFISQLYTNFLITSSCAIAYFICTSFYDGNLSYGLIPYVLWSWGMALSPWQFFASKETDNELSSITVSSAAILYFLFLLSIFIVPKFTGILIIVLSILQIVFIPFLNIYLSRRDQNEY